MKTKKAFLVVVDSFLFLLLCLVVACRGNEEVATQIPQVQETIESTDTSGIENSFSLTRTETIGDRVIIRFAVYDWELSRYESIIEAFEEENSDIEIKLVSISEVLGIDSTGDEWPDDAEIRLASTSDVLSGSFSSEAIKQGLVLDLSPFLDEDDDIIPSDFYPLVLEQSHFQGGIWSFPLDVDYNLIFYNKDAFDAVGLDYPLPGWTWDDFLDLAKALTIRNGDEVIQWGYVEPFFGSGLEQAIAGSLVNLEQDPPTINLSDAAVQDAVQWYTDLFLVHKVTPSTNDDFNGIGLPEGSLLIEDRKAGMWPESVSSWSYRSQQTNVGVVPYPVGTTNQHTTPLRIFHSLSLSSGTRFPKEAWTWVKFLSEQPDAMGLAFGSESGAATLPARRSVAEASHFWEQVDEEVGTALQYAIDHAYITSRATWGYEQFYQALRTILKGEKTVEEALASAQIEAEVARDKALAENEEIETLDVEVTSPVNEQDNPNITSITFIASNLSDLQYFRNLIPLFRESHPDINVEIRGPNFSGNVSPSFSSIAANSDCFQWFPVFDNPDNLAVILSLDPFLDNDLSINKDDFFSVATNAFTYHGELWGLPGNITINLVEYNKDLFDEASLPYPDPNWTIAEFLETAEILTAGREANKQYGYVPSLYEAQDMLAFVEQQGALLIDDSQNPPAANFDDPVTIEALQWYINLTKVSGVKPTFITNFYNTDFERFEQQRNMFITNGLAGMWTNDTRDGAVIEAELRIGVVPLPSSSNGNRIGGYSLLTGYFISKDTEASQACWDWLTFLTEYYIGTNALPARITVAESEAFWQAVGTERAKAYIDTIYSSTRPSISQRFSDEDNWIGFFFIWLVNAYDKVLNEDVSVEEAMSIAQRTADAYRACIISNDAFNNSSVQIDCLREVDDSLPDFFFTQTQ